MPKRIFVGKIGNGVVEKHAFREIRTEALKQILAEKLKALRIALRIYPEPRSVEKARRAQKRWRLPKAMLVFDTESRVDATQSMTFGSYRFIIKGRCLEEGLIA